MEKPLKTPDEVQQVFLSHSNALHQSLHLFLLTHGLPFYFYRVTISCVAIEPSFAPKTKQICHAAVLFLLAGVGEEMYPDIKNETKNKIQFRSKERTTKGPATRLQDQTLHQTTTSLKAKPTLSPPVPRPPRGR